ncbi:hypothetical protein [Amycolatopsis sp. cmx-11-51]|uniref:hypothetical protein n=1 Tax=unclassified Amycolatopsis TaxID=2618356 RepID=UPI0039E3F9B4
MTTTRYLKPAKATNTFNEGVLPLKLRGVKGTFPAWHAAKVPFTPRKSVTPGVV